MKAETKKALAEIHEKYKENGYNHLHLELQMYSIDKIEDLVSGYVPKIEYKGKIYRLWCRCGIKKAGVRFEDLIRPFQTPCPHQWWMNESTRNNIVDKLKKAKVLEQQYKCFEELYDKLVKMKITSGDLFRYDLSLRISQCLNILPKDYVYLHAGAADGAEVLHNKGLIKLPAEWKYRVRKNVFDKLFPNMEAIDIENLLCIHKKDFEKL